MDTGGSLDRLGRAPRFLHVDINSYFATVLQQENPKLRGKPVGVLKSQGRTCIIAASKEAKKLGVSTGSLVNEAKTKAPGIICVPANFDLYFYCTKTLKNIFESFNPDAEIFSLDEAFIPLDNIKLLHPDPHKLAVQIQNSIKKSLGEWVTCNVGISYNRLLAKMAGEIAPKGTILEITEENKDDYLKSVSFKDVCGVGVRLEERLLRLGVSNPHDINTLSDDGLESEFGPFLAKELRLLGKGERSYILDRGDSHEIMQSVGRSTTGYKLENNEWVIKRVLMNLIDEACFKLRKMGLTGRHVSIYLTGQGKVWFDHVTLKYYVRHSDEVFNLLYNNLYRKWKRDFKVIKYGIRISHLKKFSETQPSIFKEFYKKESLYKAVDFVTEKYGFNTLHSGVILDKEYIRPEVTGFLGDKKFLFDSK